MTDFPQRGFWNLTGRNNPVSQPEGDEGPIMSKNEE
jgi:hypothetical protein